MRRHPVILFIYKNNSSYATTEAPSSGVRSSVSFVVDMLQHHGINAVLAEAVDGKQHRCSGGKTSPWARRPRSCVGYAGKAR